MREVDTSLIIRYLTNDHPSQSAAARNIVDNEDFFVSATVLLETELVLRSAYGFSEDEVLAALGFFAGLPHAKLEGPSIARRKLWRGRKPVWTLPMLYILPESMGTKAS